MTAEEIDAKISQLKEDKKRARRDRVETDDKIKALDKTREKLDSAMSAICIAGRNDYTKGAIQVCFFPRYSRHLQSNTLLHVSLANMPPVARFRRWNPRVRHGVSSRRRPLPLHFDPEDDLRDYDEVARSLPVFCVSSRAYQKIQGRLQRDKAVPGFPTAEETEIPQLQAHCKKLTEAGRASNCRNFLTNLSQLLNSLGLWASNDGTGLNLTDAQLAAETRFLKLRLQKLEESLEKSVKECLKDTNDILAENIFEQCENLVELAVAEANHTVSNCTVR